MERIRVVLNRQQVTLLKFLVEKELDDIYSLIVRAELDSPRPLLESYERGLMSILDQLEYEC